MTAGFVDGHTPRRGQRGRHTTSTAASPCRRGGEGRGPSPHRGTFVQAPHAAGRLTPDLRGDSFGDVVRPFTALPMQLREPEGGFADGVGGAYSLSVT